MRSLLTTILLLSATTAHAAETKKLKVVVHELGTQGGIPADNGSTLSLQVCQALSEIGGYDVVCTDELKAMAEMQQRKLDLNACDSDTCFKQLGELAAADRLITGSVGRLDKSTVLTLNLIDAVTGKVLARASDKVQGGVSEVLDRIKPTLKKLLATK